MKMVLGAILIISLAAILVTLVITDKPINMLLGTDKGAVDEVYEANKKALADELQQYASQLTQFYKVSAGVGGADYDPSRITIDNVASFIGFTEANYSLKTVNGEYRITDVTDDVITIKGMGTKQKKGKYPIVTIEFNCTTNAMNTNYSEGTTL